MKDTEITTILARMKAAGLRTTSLRSALLETFFHEQKPLSFYDLQMAVEKRGLTPHKATLYRELELLETWQVITPVHFEDGLIRYEPADRKHHHHVVCLECHAVQDIPLEEHELEQEKRFIEKQTHFVIQRHSLDFFGICANCQS